MTGGVSSIWDRFRQFGISTIADLAAKWTISQLTNSKSGLLQSIGALFTGAPKAPGKNAGGTEYWSGGATWLAENGPELVTLPQGSKVAPANQTRALLSANDNGGPVHQHFYLDGAIVDQSLYQHMQAIGDNAAMRGAAGGAAIGQANGRAAAARKLGRFR